MTKEELIKIFGENNRTLIEDALNWLGENEPTWAIGNPINKQEYIADLIGTKARY